MSRKSWRKRPETDRTESRAIPGWLALGVAGLAWAAIAWAERRRPLRERRESQIVRTGRNLAMAGLSATTVTVVQNVVLESVWKRVGRGRRGLVPALRLPRFLEVIAGVLILDYTLWWWHWLNHEWRPLWRFHLVHHVDLDLDASTAARFHFGEMSASVLFRIAQLRLSGADPFTVSLWQLLLMVSILFHHSAIRLDETTDRRLAAWIVTPRMHEIHHSDIREETDSNWSSLLSVWDRIHGTYRHDVPSGEIIIGVPAYQEPESVRLPKLIVLPFEEQRDDWRAGDGVRLTRGGGGA